MGIKLQLNSILLLIVLSACCIFLSACQGQLGNRHEIADPLSSLPKALVQESDFSTDWRWIDDSVSQQTEVPTSANSQLVESASKNLAGFYSNEHYIRIDHLLQRYEQQPPSLTDLPTAVGTKTANEQTFSPKLITVGQSMWSSCIKEPGIAISCKVIVWYNHLASALLIAGPGNIDDKTMERIVDEVLIKVDERIKDIDK
ncbi:MAG: hypothetical protein HY870_12360 [Chloroflexi bacterium]|nr:hypothetical protein [Chloroflexota bacterium]